MKTTYNRLSGSGNTLAVFVSIITRLKKYGGNFSIFSGQNSGFRHMLRYILLNFHSTLRSCGMWGCVSVHLTTCSQHTIMGVCISAPNNLLATHHHGGVYQCAQQGCVFDVFVDVMLCVRIFSVGQYFERATPPVGPPPDTSR